MAAGKGATKREQREQAKQTKAQRKGRRRLLWLLAAVIVVGGGGWFYARESSLPGQQFEDQGRRHIPAGTPALSYNSNPPTSGAHSSPARWGAHAEDIPEIKQVHNLEHGGVLIQYNCARLPAGESCDALISGLRRAFNQARKEIDRKIVLAPYGKSPRPVAVTAWRWLQYFDSADEAGILAFAEAHINSAPERLP